MLVAADANALFSIVTRHAAFQAVRKGGLELASTLSTLRELKDHFGWMSEKYGLRPGVLEGRLEALELRAYGRKKYRKFLADAARRIAWRDPEDVEILALALALRVPIWTHDRDFEAAGVETYTTARLLAKLGIRAR